jgi:D-alanyl-D-alanine carboxypeptidase
MMKNRLFRTVTSAFVLVTAMSAARADAIDDLVNAQIKKRQITGLSLCVMRDGKVVKAAGYGLANMELNVPATKDTVYEIGSISKQFASEAVMLLVEDGKLGLDDPINKYLPANAPESWKAITVRQLLNHTAGLKDWTEIKEFSYRREYTAGEFIDLIKGAPLEYTPGTNWAYTNTGPPLLGIIVERASGKTYEEFVGTRIFKPMGYGTLRFRRQDEIVPNRASGYGQAEGKFKNGEPFRPRVIAPSGGVLASAVDLAGWFTAVLEGKLMKRGSLDQMLAPVRLADGRRVNHGFAFFTDSFNGHRMVFHHGSTVGGFGSVVRFYPKERLTIAVMGNLEDGGFGPEYISRRIVNFYVPGASISGLKERPDPGFNAKFSKVLHDIAAGTSSDMLTASFAGRISADFRAQMAANLKSLKTFSYLGEETIGEDHFVLDPALVKAVHYKLASGSKTVYYTFRLDKDGRVGFIVVTGE